MLNPTGLGQVDITSQGASTGIELNAAADHDDGFIMLKVYSDASDWSWASVPITNTGDGSLNSSDSQFVAFSSFTVGGGTGANFSQVGAIQLSINGVNAIDGQVGPIEAVGPMVFSENFVNVAQADLSVIKSASPNPVVAGSQLTYTFTATNNGPSNATGVTIVDTLPAGTTYISASGQSSADDRRPDADAERRQPGRPAPRPRSRSWSASPRPPRARSPTRPRSAATSPIQPGQQHGLGLDPINVPVVPTVLSRI